MIALFLAALLSIDQVGDTDTTGDVIWTGLDQQGQFDDLLEFTAALPSDEATVALNSIPLKFIDGAPYFELFLRLNETGGPNNYALLTDFSLTVNGTTLWDLASQNLGSTSGNEISFADFGPGNNQADASIHVPVDIFVGVNSTELVTIRATLDNIEAGADFIAAREGEFLPDGPIRVPPIPEPKRALLILLACVWLLMRRSRKSLFLLLAISLIRLQYNLQSHHHII